ncbi:hypothetical protein LZ31DRAFT_203611 [Colletotrichum somersetense]|nr:hypothetical protein LZ31DRAFT_203611 [Colletotrichum somersetense]
MPENASPMRDHRRNRHPQLFSPTRGPFLTLRRDVGHEVPSPPRSPSFPRFYPALPSSAFGRSPTARHDTSLNHRAPSPVPRHPGALRRENPPRFHRPRHLRTPGRDTREPCSRRSTLPSVIPSIEHGPSTRSTSPNPSSGSESRTSSSPTPPHRSLASRAYSHDGTISPLGPRPCQPETPRYVSARRPLSTSPPSSGIPGSVPGELSAALPPATPSTPSCAVAAPSGFRLGRRAKGSDLRAGIGRPHRPRCPNCGCVCGSVGDRSRRSGGSAGPAGPYHRGSRTRNQRRLR